MSKFFLLDHSLKSVGGHHFDYAFHVATAAEQAGMKPILGTHVRFRERDSLPSQWPVVAVFPHTTYSRHAIYSAGGGTGGKLGPAESATRSLQNPLNWVRDTYDQFDRARQLKQFANACRQVFAAHPLQSGDQVFVPTLSEFDLQGLVDFLASDSSTQLADWHLQFHFNVFDGREPDYDSQQDRLMALRTTFRETLARVSRHRLHFYNTSDPLTKQYEKLNVANFESLAYPINPAFFGAKPAKRAGTPIQIACAGAIREEKGQRELAQVVADLWEEGFQTGKLQLVVQSNKSRFRLPLPGAPDAGVEPIIYAKHPLSVTEYVDFIRGADIGLLMYDAQRYYVRRAGVLGELMAAGVPVIAPAGCWLSDQIEGVNRKHREQLPWSMKVVDEQSPAIAKSVEVAASTAATNLLVSFATPDAADGTFASVRLTQADISGRETKLTRVVRCESSGQAVSAVFPAFGSAASCRIKFNNAFGDSPLNLRNLRLRQLASATGKAAPCGGIGLSFANRGEIPQLLRDMAANLSHYQTSAQNHAPHWFAQHDPKATLQQLLANAKAKRYSKAA